MCGRPSRVAWRRGSGGRGTRDGLHSQSAKQAYQRACDATQVLCDLCLLYYRPAGDGLRCAVAAGRAAALAAEHGLAFFAAAAARAAAWAAAERAERVGLAHAPRWRQRRMSV